MGGGTRGGTGVADVHTTPDFFHKNQGHANRDQAIESIPEEWCRFTLDFGRESNLGTNSLGTTLPGAQTTGHRDDIHLERKEYNRK